MKFRKVYVEITNNCNLNCSFCIGNKREKEFLDMEKFQILLKKLEGYTKYLYFHVMGEPLLHPKINELIDIASKNFFINITTNGYLLNRIENNKNIRQINVSLHSVYSSNNIEEYLENVFTSASKLAQNNTFINYRLWVNNDKEDKILDLLRDKYHVSITNGQNIKLDNNIFLEFEKEFNWPSLNNKFENELGTCLGCRSHIGILVDGTVIPCCLDSAGTINLGNIYKQNLEDIIESKLFKEIRLGFLENKKVHPLCRKCDFYDQRKSSRD